MYIALAIMCGGIVAGRLFRKWVSSKYINVCVFAAIMGLLFLMGYSIGSDKALLASLPSLGKYAAILTICYLAGSIAAQMVLKKSRLLKIPKNNDG
ncbi:MAG: lysine exporter LysO family protein [Desulfovibrio sp.]|nr:lysine exporter LysO family protein [Desulfovibrio sp.]